MVDIAEIAAADAQDSDAGVDTITGNAGDDVILGGLAGDVIKGNASHDVIVGDNGVITIFSNDTTVATYGRIATQDVALGADDTIYGNAGNDVIFGGLADDIINAGHGNNIVFGDNGFIDWTRPMLSRNYASTLQVMTLIHQISTEFQRPMQQLAVSIRSLAVLAMILF